MQFEDITTNPPNSLQFCTAKDYKIQTEVKQLQQESYMNVL